MFLYQSVPRRSPYTHRPPLGRAIDPCTTHDHRRVPGERSQQGTRQQPTTTDASPANTAGTARAKNNNKIVNDASSSNGGRCKLTREELLGTTNLNERDWRFIDPELWDEDVKAPDDEVDATAATTYMARAIADYTDRPTADAELYEECKGITTRAVDAADLSADTANFSSTLETARKTKLELIV
ncbi:hypothetical protein Ptr902_02371 [Pyrenophora tritici-repentis]|nr:hypothetical protein Ptr902_02371 [Pyrenophora tritici-repentis]